jgi:hypothetical protein
MDPQDDLSMSTDNTPEGQMYGDTIEGGPISRVEIGDKVVDSTGKEIGKVKFAKMGDPSAATAEGEEGYNPSFLGFRGDPYDLNQLPEQAREQLLRVGFIHIDIPWATDRFAGAGQIARVEGNTVYLSVPEANLI